MKRRCLYYWIDYPAFESELQIVTAKVPEAPAQLARQVTAFVQELRQAELYKVPGIAETLEWTAALVVLKYQEDVVKVKGGAVSQMLNRVRAGM